MTSLTRTAGLFVLAMALSLGSHTTVFAQSGVVDPVTGQTLAQGRIRLGIAQAQAGKTLADGTKWNNTNITLNRILESVDSEFRAALSDTNKFALVSRSNLNTILQEQGLAESGNINASDPVAAQGFKIAGVKYLVIVRMNDFQDQTETRTFDQLGVKATLRNIRIDGQVELVDTTTGGILTTAPFKTEFQGSEDQAVKQGAIKNGNDTDILINQAARQASVAAVQAILDKLTPAKAMQVRDGIITFNRNKASGVNVGDLFNVYAQGEAMVDPDTGERFSEEVLVARAEVIETNERFSKARTVQGALVGPGAVLRKAVGPQEKLPLSAPPAGSVPAPQGYAPQPAAGQPVMMAPQPQGGGGSQIVYVPVQMPAQPQQEGAVQQQAPIKKTAAVFIRNRAAGSGVPDDKVTVLEDMIVGKFNTMGVSTISREDVINAVSNFASKGPNAGGADAKAKALDLILSDNTSALQLARNMGADMILIGSVTGMDRDTRKMDTNGVQTTIDNYTLTLSYRILDAGGKGNVMTADVAKSTESVRQLPGLTVTTNPIDRLLSQTSDKLAGAFDAAVKRGEVAPQAASKIQGQVKISCTIPEMTVPELIKQENGEYKFVEGAYAISPSDVTVEIDGLAVGSAPGTFNVGPGIHTIRLSRPGFQTSAFKISGPESASSPALAFNVAIKMTDAELQKWRQNIVLINTLKNVNKVTDAHTEQIKGFAQFLRQSHLRIEGSPTLNIGGYGLLWDLYNQQQNQPRPQPQPAPAPQQ